MAAGQQLHGCCQACLSPLQHPKRAALSKQTASKMLQKVGHTSNKTSDSDSDSDSDKHADKQRL